MDIKHMHVQYGAAVVSKLFFDSGIGVDKHAVNIDDKQEIVDSVKQCFEIAFCFRNLFFLLCMDNGCADMGGKGFNALSGILRHL